MSRYLRIALFFALSCLLTWWPFLFREPGAEATNFAFGPLIAAPIVIFATEGREGLMRWARRILRFRAPLWVYATALFGPLAIAALTAVITASTGAPPGAWPGYSTAELLLFVGLVMLDGPAPEEMTFRGYGQHELQQAISPFAASLWIGTGVVVWHLPLLISGEDPWIIAVAIMAVSVVYAWLYQAGGSVWPLAIVHFSHNYFGGGIFSQLFAGDDRMIFYIVLVAIYAIWAGLIVWRLGPSLGRKSADEGDTAMVGTPRTT